MGENKPTLAFEKAMLKIIDAIEKTPDFDFDKCQQIENIEDWVHKLSLYGGGLEINEERVQ